MDRSEGLFDLREGDALRKRDPLFNNLGFADQNIEVSVVKFPGSFGWDDDEVVQGLKTGYYSSFEGIVEGWRHSGEDGGGQLLRKSVSTHAGSVAVVGRGRVRKTDAYLSIRLCGWGIHRQLDDLCGWLLQVW